MTNRRGFLKGMLAGAVALAISRLPSIPNSASATVVGADFAKECGERTAVMISPPPGCVQMEVQTSRDGRHWVTQDPRNAQYILEYGGARFARLRYTTNRDVVVTQSLMLTVA